MITALEVFGGKLLTPACWQSPSRFTFRLPGVAASTVQELKTRSTSAHPNIGFGREQEVGACPLRWFECPFFPGALEKAWTPTLAREKQACLGYRAG